MDKLFGKKPTVKEQLKENDRALRKVNRDVDRDRRELEREEKKLEADIKKVKIVFFSIINLFAKYKVDLKNIKYLNFCVRFIYTVENSLFQCTNLWGLFINSFIWFS